MARKRMLDPSIWDSEDVAKMSDREFRVYIWTISNADDEGRLRIPWSILHTRIFPSGEVSPEEVREVVAELGARGQFTFYTVDGVDYIAHHNWLLWQKINRPTPSRYPSPDEASVSTHGGLSEDSVSDHGGLTPNRIEVNRIEVNRTSRKTAPLKDEVGRWIEDHMDPFENFARERGQIKNIVARCRRRSPDAPLEVAQAMVAGFQWLRENGDKFWMKQPFIPSALSSLWERVETEMKREMDAVQPEWDETAGENTYGF